MVTFAPAAAEMRLLTPPMQAEVDAIVFDKQPQRKPMLKHEKTAPDFVMARSGVMGAEGKDTESNFKDLGMTMKDTPDEQFGMSLAFDRVYDSRHEGKATESHFKDLGMTMEATPDEQHGMALPFDRVYDSKFEDNLQE